MKRCMVGEDRTYRNKPHGYYGRSQSQDPWQCRLNKPRHFGRFSL
jgi:hypothetical protein